MARIGAAWDRTTEVFRGRGRMLAGIAALTFVLPGAIRAGLQFFVAPGSGDLGTRALIALVSLLAAAATLYGQLALVAAASDPATLERDAYGIAWRRFWPALGLVLLLAVAFGLATVPIGVAVGLSGVDLRALDMQAAMSAFPTWLVAFVSIYGLLFIVAALYVSTRLFVLNPVIVNERRGTGSIARSFALTRGAGWRIFGTVLLLLVVLLVAVAAAQSVTGIVAVLVLGTGNAAAAAFLAALAGSIVTAAYSVVMVVLATQFYLLSRAERDGGVGHAAT